MRTGFRIAMVTALAGFGGFTAISVSASGEPPLFDSTSAMLLESNKMAESRELSKSHSECDETVDDIKTRVLGIRRTIDKNLGRVDQIINQIEAGGLSENSLQAIAEIEQQLALVEVRRKQTARGLASVRANSKRALMQLQEEVDAAVLTQVEKALVTAEAALRVAK